MIFSEKQAFLALVGVVALVTCTFSTLALMDYQQVREKEKECRVVSTGIRSLQTKINRINGLSRTLDEMRRGFDHNLDKVPEQEFQAELLRGIKAQATNSELELTSYAIREDSQRGRRNEARLPYSTITILLTVKGSFFQIAGFINRLEHYPRLLNLMDGRFRVPGSGDKTEHLEFTCSVETYTQKIQSAPEDRTGKIWQSVEIPRHRMINSHLPNPFAMRLRKLKTPPGPGRPLQPLPRSEEKMMIQEFLRRLSRLELGYKNDEDPKALFHDWKALKKDVDNIRFETAGTRIRLTRIRHRVDGMEGPVKQRYGADLCRRARLAVRKMKVLSRNGDFPEALSLFVALVNDLKAVPFQASISSDLSEGSGIFLQVLHILLNRRSDPVTVIQAVTDLEAALKGRSGQSDLLSRAREYKRRAAILAEFLSLPIQVSGIIWTPEKSGRVALVNGRGYVQGENLSITGRDNRQKIVRILRVGRSKYVHFEYEDLEIRVKVGNAEEGVRR